MTTIAPTVAELVIARPATARVFERHGIDYCCHGDRPLDAACAAAGVAPDRVLAELEQLDDTAGGAAPEAASGHDAGVGALIEHIVATHHTYLRRELPRLGELMSKVVAAHSERHPEVHAVAATLAEITADLLPHLAKEERVLFPLTIELLGAVTPTELHCGSIRNPIHVMFAEHDRVGDLLATLRVQTDRYRPPADACPTWRALYAGLAELEADTHTHVHLENNVLFPRIVGIEAALGAAPPPAFPPRAESAGG